MFSIPTVLCAALALLSLGPSQFCQQRAQTVPQKQWSWNDCGTARSPVSITDVQFSTDKPKPGDELTVKVIGNSKVDIEPGAYTDVLLMLGRFEYINKSYDLCDKTQFNTTCPLKAGNQELVNTIYIQNTMPIASYYMKYHAYTEDNEELGCAEFDIKLTQ